MSLKSKTELEERNHDIYLSFSLDLLTFLVWIRRFSYQKPKTYNIQYYARLQGICLPRKTITNMLVSVGLSTLKLASYSMD
jgi:hypothetical protein